MKKPIVIGVTGGIGSGKSSVVKLFQEKNIPVYYADIEAKILMESNHDLAQNIIKEFGENAYVNKKLNREFLAKQVFTNPVKLKKLNKLVHPVVNKHFEKYLKTVQDPFVIYENAILFENGFDKICDYIIAVTAPEHLRIDRVKKRDAMSVEQISQRMSNQWSDEEKVKKSDFVIYNDEWEKTLVQFDAILHKINLITTTS